MKTVDAARGHWGGILKSFGVDGTSLTGKHAPCPLCGGTDRFRFDNKDGEGTWICNQCGAGKGMDLLMKATGMDFKTAAGEVDQVIGNVSKDAPSKPKFTPDQCRKWNNELWQRSAALAEGDLVWCYLEMRAPGWLGSSVAFTEDLRFCERTPLPGGGECPAMLAMIRHSVTGEPASIHRTFLSANGGKADMPNPRAMMPGDLPETIGVRLSHDGKSQGIAEGIENAMAAALRFGVGCDAAINATMLAKWEPRAGVSSVCVMGDCDANFHGQSVAYRTAHRLSRKVAVDVKIPGHDNPFGTDWADVA